MPQPIDHRGCECTPHRPPFVYMHALQHAITFIPTSMLHLLHIAWWWTLYIFILLPIRFFFGILLPPILTYFWHNRSVYHLAQDDRPVYEHCRVVGRNIIYGRHRRETMDVLIPDKTVKNCVGDGNTWVQMFIIIVKSAIDLLMSYPYAIMAWLFSRPGHMPNELDLACTFKPILFTHGGGMCAVDPSIQHHQLTAFVRGGFAVYSMAYPHAPEDQYPTQVLSILRALSWMKTMHHHESVALIGESAGGTLVTCAAALVSNHDALVKFDQSLRHIHHITHEDILQWDFPTISSVTSWYGILDGDSWKWGGSLWWGLHFTQSCYVGMNPFPTFLTSVSPQAAIGGGRRHECEFIDLVRILTAGHVKKFPPALFISGTADPLGLAFSSRLAVQKLKACVTSEVTLSEYDAGHAFIGLNPFVLYVLQGKDWRKYALTGTVETLEFIMGHYSS